MIAQPNRFTISSQFQQAYTLKHFLQDIMHFLKKNLAVLFAEARDHGQIWDYNKHPKDLDTSKIDVEVDLIVTFPQVTGPPKDEKKQKIARDIACQKHIVDLISEFAKDENGDIHRNLSLPRESNASALNPDKRTGTFFGSFNWGTKIDTLKLIHHQVLSPTPYRLEGSNCTFGNCNRCLLALPLGRACDSCRKDNRKLGYSCLIYTKVKNTNVRLSNGQQKVATKTFRRAGDRMTVERCYFNPAALAVLFHRTPSSKFHDAGYALNYAELEKLSSKMEMPIAINAPDCAYPLHKVRNIFQLESGMAALYEVFKHWSLDTVIHDMPETTGKDGKLIQDLMASAIIYLVNIPEVKQHLDVYESS